MPESANEGISNERNPKRHAETPAYARYASSLCQYLGRHASGRQAHAAGRTEHAQRQAPALNAQRVPVMMSNAARWRSIGIGMVIELAMPTPPDTCKECGQPENLLSHAANREFPHVGHAFRQVTYGSELGEMPAAELSENIAKLAQLGRTPRWNSAIARWSSMVAEAGDDRESLRWALLQGCVYAGNACE